jgi:hypothetical protein
MEVEMTKVDVTWGMIVAVMIIALVWALSPSPSVEDHTMLEMIESGCSVSRPCVLP